MFVSAGLSDITYSSAAAAYFATLSVQPSSSLKYLINKAFVDMVSSGAFATLDALYLHAVGNELDNRINLVTPGTSTLTLVGGGPTFTAFRGVAGDGAATGYDTGINCSLGATKYSLNAAMLAVWSRTELDASQADAGAGTSSRMISRVSGALNVRPNTTSGATATVASSVGLLGFARAASGNVDLFRNATLLANVSNTSVAISNASIKICHAATVFSTRQLAMTIFGSATQAQVAQIYNAWLPYMARVGAV